MSNVHFITVDGSGKILTSGITQETALEFMPGAVVVPGPVDPQTHYVDQEVVVPMGAKPSKHHEFDYVTKTWIDPRTLADHKSQRMSVLKLARDTHINGGFAWSGSTFDSDPVSQTRLLGLKVKAQADANTLEMWRLQDNTWRQLTAGNVLAVWDAFETHLRTAFQTFAGLEAQVISATTVAEVEAVVWA